MTIVATEFSIVSQDAVYTVPGNFSVQEIVNNYSATVPGIGSMTSTETIETRANGQVKVITFSPRTGTKG
jgi:hypothetical protein